MKTNPSTPLSQTDVEKDLESLAPLVRAAFCQAGEPSPEVIRSIHEEALAYLSARHRSRFTPLFRTLAAAATLAFLLGGAIQTRLSQVEGAHARDIAHLLNIGAPHVTAETSEGASELASRLLNIQGLDEDAFFKSEEAESLWL